VGESDTNAAMMVVRRHLPSNCSPINVKYRTTKHVLSLSDKDLRGNAWPFHAVVLPGDFNPPTDVFAPTQGCCSQHADAEGGNAVLIPLSNLN
jgi:hypothetical protein